jgi:hypothetical protein
MTTIHGPADIASLLDRWDEHGKWMRRLDVAYREGWRAAELAHADDHGRGYGDGVLARKRAQHDLFDAAKVYARRWTVRGEQRTRATFGRPHPDDYPGKDAA